MSKKLSKELIDDIFSIPRDGSNINTDIADDTSEVLDNQNVDEISVSFEEKVLGLQKDLKNIKEEEKPAIPNFTEKKQVSKQEDIEKQTLVTALVSVIKKSEENDDIFADVVSSSSSSNAIVNVKTEIINTQSSSSSSSSSSFAESKQVHPSLNVETEDDKEDEDAHVINYEKIYFQFPNGKYMWKFKSPDKKYDYFYNEKKHIVTNMLKDKEISFQEYYEELSNVNIDVNVDSYDTDALGKKITEVMKWRDRVKYIQLHLHAQYFGFKAFEDLLKGVLARIEYVRGKQEGIVYEHMSDFVGYVAELEGLYKSAEIVSKHLDAAYASLSRQIAIAQPFHEVDRYSSNNNIVPKLVSKELSRFDSLSQNANVNNSVVADNLKEAEKSVESTTKSGWKLK